MPLAYLFGSGVLLGFDWLFATPCLRTRLRTRVGLVWWLAVPLAGVIGFGLACTDKGFALRVSLSESNLLDLGNKVSTGVIAVDEATWVGLFQVRKTWDHQGAYFFFTSQSYLNQEGVAFLPAGIQPPGRISVTPLYGSWYRFTWRF